MRKGTDGAIDIRRSLGSAEGYLALALVAVSCLAPGADHSSHARVIAGSVYFGVAFGLAIAGVRFGEGGGRLAAKVALGIQSFWLLLILVAGLLRWEEVAWYWTH